jgi:hypothetical protein
MNNHRTRSHNHRPDASTTNQHTPPACSNPPSTIFACIDRERILVTIAEYGWRTYIRRENPTIYTVRYENAAGVRSGKLHVDRRETRQLVAEKCREAVWIDLQDRTEWPGDEEAVDGGER